MYATLLILLGLVRATLGSQPPQSLVRSAMEIGLLIVVLGLAEQAAVRRFAERPLPCGDARALAAAYRVRFFVRVAFAQTAPVFAFSLSFITGWWWVYLFGLVPAAVGLSYAAPTRTAIEREQRALNDRCSDVNLLGALLAEKRQRVRP